MREPPQAPGGGPSRTRIMGLTLVADIAGVALIVFVLPFAWSTRLLLVAIYLVAVNALSRLYLNRAAGS